MKHGKRCVGDHNNKHFFSSVKVGMKGQIVIPCEVRSMFDIKPGDTLILVAKEGHGIGILKESLAHSFTFKVLEKFGMKGKEEAMDDQDTSTQ
ncbi:MAG: hypothetical protein QG605_1365 [Euryarchaeota archaeon]|nr:hypothetical protein [Euryarchaeota archaeon]